MFLAALTSRCRDRPQEGQSCQRTPRSFRTMLPQPEQAWLVYAGLTSTYSAPASTALYRTAPWNALQLASDIERANRRFLSMLPTPRRSAAISPYLPTKLLDNLWLKSLLLFAIPA